MSLAEIVTKIKNLKPFAEENLDNGPVETLSGRRGRKNQAITQLSSLRTEYRSEMLRSAIFIIVVGNGRDEFIKQASENFNCFAADPEAFYKDLASRIPPTLYLGKESVSNVFDVLSRHLEDKALELGILEYPQLIFKQTYRRALKNEKDFISLVKEAINEQVGAEIVGVQATHTLVDTAIEREHNDKFTPIVLGTGDEVFATRLAFDLCRLTGRVFTIVTGKSPKSMQNIEDVIRVKEPTQESVAQAMSTIKSQLKR